MLYFKNDDTSCTTFAYTDSFSNELSSASQYCLTEKAARNWIMYLSWLKYLLTDGKLMLISSFSSTAYHMWRSLSQMCSQDVATTVQIRAKICLNIIFFFNIKQVKKDWDWYLFCTDFFDITLFGWFDPSSSVGNKLSDIVNYFFVNTTAPTYWTLGTFYQAQPWSAHQKV